MAQKEATVYIVDVGASMDEKRNGRQVTDLDWALEYVWDKISATVATERKTAHVAVIGLRTDESQNELDNEEAYYHISILKGLGQMLMPDVRRLRDELKPSQTNGGDAISALIIAIQLISSHCRKLQYQRRIVLVTDGRGVMDADDITEVAKKMKEDNTELVILGVDFDDPEYGFKEEDKDDIKAGNEAAFKNLVDECNGLYGTLAQAIDELSIPRIKTVKPIPSFKGFLTLGNPEEYDSAMAIDVERYPRVMVQRPPAASQFVIRSNMAPGETQPLKDLDGLQDDLAAVKNIRTHQIIDENAPGGKRDIPMEDLAKGYSYGSTAVPISESDRNVTTFETRQGLDLVGFVTKDQYERYMDMSKSNVIVAQRTNDKANMALSSFIHALYELESYAVARLVPKENKQPNLVLLAPSIEPDLECLYEIELPFAEDVRSYRFPPLDKIVTVSGKELKQHRNLPNDALVQAMSDYVDQMDLSTFGEDDEGNPSEYVAIEETFSPVLHRVNQVIRHRAVHADNSIPPVHDILTKYSQPPAELAQKAQPALTLILEAADLKKGKFPSNDVLYTSSNSLELTVPLSGLDVSGLLSTTKRDEHNFIIIDANNAIPEFKQMLEAAEANATSTANVESACRQLGDIVRGYIRSSVGGSGYGRAVEAVRVMREEVVDHELPSLFNDFVRSLKKEILGGKLGGERGEMWFLLRKARLGLVQKKEVGSSEVEEEEAKTFLYAK
ncbi:hypothetical protein MBLNU459_g1680t2 [Dothideomycetes sp. NU459]